MFQFTLILLFGSTLHVFVVRLFICFCFVPTFFYCYLFYIFIYCYWFCSTVYLLLPFYVPFNLLHFVYVYPAFYNLFHFPFVTFPFTLFVTFYLHLHFTLRLHILFYPLPLFVLLFSTFVYIYVLFIYICYVVYFIWFDSFFSSVPFLHRFSLHYVRVYILLFTVYYVVCSAFQFGCCCSRLVVVDLHVSFCSSLFVVVVPVLHFCSFYVAFTLFRFTLFTPFTFATYVLRFVFSLLFTRLHFYTFILF